MNSDKIIALKEKFDSLAEFYGEAGEVEVWRARRLQELFGYQKWENFELVIERAIISCQNGGLNAEDHFLKTTGEVVLGKGGRREIADYILTRYAGYLVAQNGDPRKEEIAFAQSYFAVQTRRVEIIQERLSYIERAQVRHRLQESEKLLSQNIYERGVDEKGFGRIRSKGDAALFGGIPTAEMKSRLAMNPNRPLADFLPTLTIAAKNLATEMTNYNVVQQDLQGEYKITGEHVQNNASVRDMLVKRGIIPELLPPEEDFRKQERRAKTQEKRLAISTLGIPHLANGESEKKINYETGNAVESKIISYLENREFATSADIARFVNMSPASVSRHANRLVAQGKLRKEIQGKRTIIWMKAE